MVDLLSIVELGRPTSRGETKPWGAICERPDGTLVEVVLKAASHVPGGVKALGVEWALANLAGDLSLPICEPHLVRLDVDSLTGLADQGWAAKALGGNPIAFASCFAGSNDAYGGFSAWTAGYRPIGPWLEQAWHTAAFDVFTDNIDRKPSNPNCLVRGEEFRIFDHEKCFAALGGLFILGPKPKKPWEVGGADLILGEQGHIFSKHLRTSEMPRAAMKDAWLSLSEHQIKEYGLVLPPDWSEAIPVINAIATAVTDIQANIDGCLDELSRCMS